MHDHAVELELVAPDEPGAGDARTHLMQRHREHLRASVTDGFLDRCAQTRTPAYVSCALAAEDLDAFRRCEGGPRP